MGVREIESMGMRSENAVLWLACPPQPYQMIPLTSMRHLCILNWPEYQQLYMIKPNESRKHLFLEFLRQSSLKISIYLSHLLEIFNLLMWSSGNSIKNMDIWDMRKNIYLCNENSSHEPSKSIRLFRISYWLTQNPRGKL